MNPNNRPKLIYVSNARIPSEKANSVQSMNQCEAFAEHFQVSFWHAKRINELSHIEPFSYYGVEKSFSLEPVSSLDMPWLRNIYSRLGFLIQAASYMICLLFRIVFWRSWKFLYDRNSLDIFLLPFIRLVRPDLTILIEDQDNLFRNFLKIKLWFLKFASGVVITSTLHRAAYLQHGYPENKILVAPNGVNLNRFNQNIPKKMERLHLKKKSICNIYYIGNLFKRKGVYSLAEAAKYLSTEYCLNFVGGSPETLPDFETYVAQIESKATIKLHGHIEPKKIPEILGHADIVVIPNSANEIIASHYTSPLKLYEYMAARKAIIASDLPALRELLHHNSNAWLVEPDNALALADAIKHLNQNLDEAERLADQAYEDVQNYSYSARAQKIYDFFLNQESMN